MLREPRSARCVWETRFCQWWKQAVRLLGDSEAAQYVRETYRPGETLGTAFARLYAKIFAEWGVIVLDASDGELHRVAEPIYRAAVERVDELDAALLARGEALEAAGYHQQVKVTSSSVLAVYAAPRGADGDSSPGEWWSGRIRD